MNVFEDLVEELKDENLLESTVIESSDHRGPGERHSDISGTGDESLAELCDYLNDTDDGAGFEGDSVEAYKQRAIDEIASLQMVEHIFTGVEQQNKKPNIKRFDDLEVKKASSQISTGLGRLRGRSC